MPEGRVVLTDQAAALARVEHLVDAELWRADRRAVALAVLRGLVCGMSWDSGLVGGVTRAHLAADAACSVRTVSRVVAWAVEVGLVVVVETGATAEFLGTTTNRAPSYVLTAEPVPPQGMRSPDLHQAAPGAGAVDALGNPPASGGWKTSPRQDRGLKDRQDAEPWPLWDSPTTPAERARAVDRILDRTGLGARVVRWRAVAMLGPWFADGWSVAGLLWALDRHPDRPGVLRGDATRAARDPLRVLGHRLSPWRGRLADVPTKLRAVDGQARRARLTADHTGGHAVAEAIMAGGHGQRPQRPSASVATRAQAMADMARVLQRPPVRPRSRGSHAGRLAGPSGVPPVVEEITNGAASARGSLSQGGARAAGR